MNKVTIAVAAEHFGISKEAIHNRIRRGSLQSSVENGIKMVLLDPQKTPQTRGRRVAVKESVNDERYYKLLEEQNAKLQARVDTLENETRSLRDQKELMLIQEREKIEQIYKEKDEQLKNILSSISSQFLLNTPVLQDANTVDVEIQNDTISEVHAPISLKKYLKNKDYSDKKKKKIIEKFSKKSNKDERIVMIGDKMYIDLMQYDYSDLLP